MKLLISTISILLFSNAFANRDGLAELEKQKAKYLSQLERYINTPEWSPENNQEIPLKINEAVKVAKVWALKKWQNVNAFKILEIKLSSMISGKEGTWWAYHIIVIPEPWSESYVNNIGSEIVITMSGTVERYRDLGTKKFVLTSQLKEDN